MKVRLRYYARKKKRNWKKKLKIAADIVPEYIDFGFHKIKVEKVTTKFMREEAGCDDDGGGEEYETPEGLWDTDINTIYLLKKLSRAKMRYYLMHEMVHAALDLMDSLETGP